MIQMVFSEIRMSGVAGAPVIVLREADGARSLAIWVTAGAAAAVMAALEDEAPEHPSTHDLLLEVLATQSAVIERVDITGCQDGVFSAQLTVNGITVACRAADGVALALRSGAVLRADETMLDEYGLAPLDIEDRAATRESDALAEFRAFLADVNPDDFGAPPA